MKRFDMDITTEIVVDANSGNLFMSDDDELMKLFGDSFEDFI